jgi:phosphoglycolate phosphatase
MTATPRLVVFDCDGTLVDSQHLIAEAMRLAFLGVDLLPPDRSVVLRTVGLSIPEAVAHLAPEQASEMRDEIGRGYKERCLKLRQLPHMQEPLFHGAAALLCDLAANENLVLGIATGKSRKGVERFLGCNGLEGIFSTIQTADDAPSKPHPAMLFQAMDETGVGPESAVMVGDTSFDMMMAARARVLGIGVTWGYHSVGELKRGGAHTIVRSFSALSQALLPDASSGPRAAVA